MNDAQGNPIVVSELEDLGNDTWSCLVTTPDGKRHRVVIPGSIATVHGVQLTAAVVANLYAQGSLAPRRRLNYG